MEKRLVAFAFASLLLWFGFIYLNQVVLGPKMAAQQAAEEQALEQGAADQDPLPGDADAVDGPPAAAVAPTEPTDEPPAPPAEQPPPAVPIVGEERLIQFGSLDPASPYQMLVTASSVGASIVRVELNAPTYTDLEDESGYLGNLALVDSADGVTIRLVGTGSPAAEAGLRGRRWNQSDHGVELAYAGDTITAVNGTAMVTTADFDRVMSATKPGQTVELTVRRADGASSTMTIPLVKRPLQLLRPEVRQQPDEPPSPASFLFTLHQLGENKTRFDADELSGLPSLHGSNWSVEPLDVDGGLGPGVEFRRALTADELAALPLEGSLELIKRYRLATVDRQDEENEATNGALGYRLSLEIEVRNVGDTPLKVGYQLDGPSGLTPEGWWYSYKVHPTKMSVAGARDVAWREADEGHQLFVCSGIAAHEQKNPDSPDQPLADTSDPVELAYAGTDAQYFSAIMMSEAWVANHVNGQPPDAATARKYQGAFARVIGPVDKKKKKYTNVTCRLKSQPRTVKPGAALTENYTVFLGPKEPAVVRQFGLDDIIVYGWFWWVAKPMRLVLHAFHMLTGKFSFGLAIILLTVLVRALLYPFGRKMARNAQKMQELAPEMKRIADKYKNDVEKRTKAQQDLFKKHNYNPLSGCLVIFIQTPVFLGLYRCIGTDISLRQAPLLPGMQWCSNLAGPDRFLYWRDFIPGALASETGWLGPYLNLLPLAAVGLILAQQKLFTPPPQDEQQKMQQSVMKFMMIFMGAIFFKFAAGLCLYIIVSTLWGLGERLMLPKPTAAAAGGGSVESPPASPPPKSSSNGSSSSARRRKKKRKK